MGGGDVWRRVYAEAAATATTSGEPGDVRIVGVRTAGGNRKPRRFIPKFNIHIAAGRTGFPRNAAQITIWAMMMEYLEDTATTAAAFRMVYDARRGTIPPEQLEMVDRMLFSIARIVCGGADYHLYWDDIREWAEKGRPRP